MSLPKDVKYTQDHEWVKIEGDTATIGITDYAQGELGDIVYVELPASGDSFNKGDAFGNVEAVKAVSDLYMPLSGEILEVNEKLADAPETVNAEPYGDGWMIKFKIGDASQLDSLLDAAGYEALI